MNSPSCYNCNCYEYKYDKEEERMTCKVCTSFGIPLDDFDIFDFYCGFHQDFKAYQNHIFTLGLIQRD